MADKKKALWCIGILWEILFISLIGPYYIYFQIVTLFFAATIFVVCTICYYAIASFFDVIHQKNGNGG